MKMKSFLAMGWLLASLSIAPLVTAAAPPSPRHPDLASGPYSHMHMLLEKTILNVDVLTVDVHVGKNVHAQLLKIAKGKKYSKDLGNQAARVAIGADHALVQLKFERDVSLDQWIDAVRENLEQARAAGLISAAVEKKVSNGLPQWFASIKDRGYKEKDRVLYRVRPGSLRTVVVDAGGKVLVDRTDSDKDAPRVVMASYFAPGSDFRDLLLQSLFK